MLVVMLQSKVTLPIVVIVFVLQWVTLEDVKTGMVHLEMTWFSLHDDPSLLKLVRLLAH